MSTKRPKLPSEIVFDILSGLSVKSLLRFKCVSKAWCSLICDPQFSKIHLQRTKEDTNFNPHKICISSSPLLLSIDPEASISEVDGNLVTTQLKFPGRNLDQYDFEIVGFCNGLGCAAFYYPNPMIVWNPSTGDYRELPEANTLPDGEYFYGFGYDFQLDDYKIVRGTISTSTNNGSYHRANVEVLTLKSKTWRPKLDLECSAVFKGSGTYVNGVLHWLVESENVPDEVLVVVSLDLIEEKFLKVLPGPNIIDRDYYCSKLKVARECLCVYISYRRSIYESYFEAWMLKESEPHSCWARLSRFSNDQLPVSKRWLDLLYVTKDDDIWLDLDGSELVLHNPREDTGTRFTIAHGWDWFITTTYTESLVSPNA